MIYFFLTRKTQIPKTTVIAVMVAGLLIGSYFLPQNSQLYLDYFKTWLLPVLELSVLTFIVFKVRGTLKKRRSKDSTSTDFFSTLKEVCYTFLPSKLVVPFATEVAVLYYAFITWKKRPLKKNEFSYYKDSSALAIFGALILVAIIETSVFHILLSKWSLVAAWIVTAISLYTIVQILGISKSLSRRPIIVGNDILYLRYGILNEALIALENIEKIELSSKELDEESEIKNLSPLGKLEGHNVIIYLKVESTLSGFYGIKKKFKAMAFHVDDENQFIGDLDNVLSSTSE